MLVGVVSEGSTQKTSACANGLKTLSVRDKTDVMVNGHSTGQLTSETVAGSHHTLDGM